MPAFHGLFPARQCQSTTTRSTNVNDAKVPEINAIQAVAPIDAGLDAAGGAIPISIDGGSFIDAALNDDPRDASADSGRVDAALRASDGGESCDVRLCQPGEICWSRTEACVPRSFGQVGASCFIDDDCQQGICHQLPDAQGDAVRGFCWQQCSSDEGVSTALC